MEHKVPCGIIQDLMPLYVDGLTSKRSNVEIEKHIEECKECKTQYDNMKKQIVCEEKKHQELNEREINYLKKVKNSTHKKVFFGVVMTSLIAIALIVIKLYVIGYPTDSYYVTYADVDENHVRIGGAFYNSASSYRRYKLKTDDDGNSKLVIYACLPSPWNNDGFFNIEINLDRVETEVDINGITVKDNGIVVSKLANDLYDAKNPYVGDMSSNGKIAMTLGIGYALGDYKNSLQTSTEPYEWTLEFEESVSNSITFEEDMKNYSCVLMALVGNLGKVNWTYTVELEDRAVQRKSTITENECTVYVGTSIKTFSESPEKLQELLDYLGIKS